MVTSSIVTKKSLMKLATVRKLLGNAPLNKDGNCFLHLVFVDFNNSLLVISHTVLLFFLFSILDLFALNKSAHGSCLKSSYIFGKLKWSVLFSTSQNIMLHKNKKMAFVCVTRF